MYKKKNFAKTLCAEVLAIAETDLTIVTDDGVKFPDVGATNKFMGVLWGTAFASPEADPDREIVEAYQSATDVMTIVRAQESTVAKQWEIGDNFMLTVTSGVFDEYETAIAAKQDIETAVMTYNREIVCRVATTANITLSNTQTVDGVALAAGDYVLVKNQTTGSQNGIYVVVSGGAWTRVPEYDATLELDKYDIFVTAGTASAKTWWVCATKNATVGTTALVFAQIPNGIGTGADQALAGNTAIPAKCTAAEADAATLDTKFTTPLTARKLTPAPASDHLASGITAPMVAAQTTNFGDVCYINSAGKLALIDADAIATMSGCFMCADATIAADATGTFLMLGFARDDSWAWTVGGLIYGTVTGTTGNTLSQTMPTGTDDVVQILGVATHADRMLFNPQLVQIERT